MGEKDKSMTGSPQLVMLIPIPSPIVRGFPALFRPPHSVETELQTSNLKPQTSYLIPHTSYLKPSNPQTLIPSYLKPHTSTLKPSYLKSSYLQSSNPQYLIPHTSYLKFLNSEM